MVMLFGGTLMLGALGLQRVQYVREQYRLGQQLRQRERELVQMRRAYQVITAHVAEQEAQDLSRQNLVRTDASRAGRPVGRRNRSS